MIPANTASHSKNIGRKPGLRFLRRQKMHPHQLLACRLDLYCIAIACITLYGAPGA